LHRVNFSPEYIRLVLDENFEDAKAHFLAPLMAINYAHLIMLVEQGIVSGEEGRAIRTALDGISLDEVRNVTFDGTCEDLFFYIERLVERACGEDIAGRLHTARSRNDIDMTMYRMRQRMLLLRIAESVLSLRRVLLGLAARHREDVFAAHTHTQPAQPTTLAHYLLAIVEQLERDAVRLRAAYASTNRSPLGSCAITGTGFPIDRHRTAALLGFDGPTGNTYGSIATVDYLLESVGAVAVLLAGLGRVVQDLLLWCTSEFGYFRLSDGFVQFSSIMPQKRNPVALEHARAIASKALGQASAILLSVHNTPFGDIVDTEDDLQPLVIRTFNDAARAVSLVAAALECSQFDVQKLAARAEQGWITVTELADTLVRDHAVAFRTAHTIARRLIEKLSAERDRGLSASLRELSGELAGREIVYDDQTLARILSARHFVQVRTTPGGPAPSETLRAIDVSSKLLDADEQWRHDARERLSRSETELTKRSAQL
jgi:argininosuccinate lyase